MTKELYVTVRKAGKVLSATSQLHKKTPVRECTASMGADAGILASNQSVSALLDGMGTGVNRGPILVEEGNVTAWVDAELQSRLASVNAARDGRAASVTRGLTRVSR